MLPNKLRAAIVDHQMCSPGDLIVVGVSGGPDSVALLYGLSALAVEFDIQLHVAHLNHMLRGAEAAADADYVGELAGRLGWSATIAGRDVDAFRRRYRMTLEEAGRWARYTFFAEVARDRGASSAAVGHSATDQVETVLLHWLRGASASGMRGMQPVIELRLPEFEGLPGGRLRLLRPLLDVSRSEVEDFCRVHDLQPREDHTNRDRGFTRNRVRWELLPSLRKYNPRFDEAALRSAKIAAVDDDYLRSQMAALWPTLVSELDGKITYDLHRWSTLMPSMQYRLLREGAVRLLGNLFEMSAVHLDSAVNVMSSGLPGSVVTWPHGLRLTKRYSDFLLHREIGSIPVLGPSGEHLSVPGETVVGGCWRVVSEIFDNSSRHSGGVWHADLDARFAGHGLRVRRRRSGDRFQPLGMAQEKKLQDFLVDAKVPRGVRDDVPLLVTSDDRIAWVVGQRVAEWAKVRVDTLSTLCLRFEKVGTPI